MNDDGLSPGDIGDPVADNIRSEMNADAAPAPDEYRGPQTCDECGEARESARSRGTTSYTPRCPGQQAPPPDAGGTMCAECWALARESKMDAIRRHFAEGDDYVVEYGCGVLKPIDETAAALNQFDEPHGPPGWSPSAPLRHPQCGKSIEYVWFPGDVDE